MQAHGTCLHRGNTSHSCGSPKRIIDVTDCLLHLGIGLLDSRQFAGFSPSERHRSGRRQASAWYSGLPCCAGRGGKHRTRWARGSRRCGARMPE